MGFQLSKPSKKQDVEKIRDRIKTGNVSSDEIQQFHRKLTDYRRASKRRNTQRLINKTLKELGALKEQKRTIQEPPPKLVEQIQSEVGKIKEKIRGNKKTEDYANLKKILDIYLEQLNVLGPVPNQEEINQLKELIIGLNEEILSKYNKPNLDIFETRIISLKNDMKTAKENKDINHVDRTITSVKALREHVRHLDVDNKWGNVENKDVVDKNALRLLQQLEKIKTQLTDSNNVSSTAKCLQYLENIEEGIEDICKRIALENFKDLKEQLDKYRKKVESVEDIDQRITLKKSDIFDLFSNAEGICAKLEAEDKLIWAQQRLNDCRDNLTNFSEQKEALLELRQDVDQMLEISQKVLTMKNSLIEDIDKTIIAVDRLKIHTDQQKQRFSNQEQEEKENLLAPTIETNSEAQTNQEIVIRPHSSNQEQVNSSRLSHPLNAKRQDDVDSARKEETTLQVITRVEKELKDLEPDVYAFVGLESSSRFFELDETLIRETLILDGLKLEISGELHAKKIELLRQINKLNNVLDENARQSAEMDAVEEEVNISSTKIHSFNGHFEDNEYNMLKDYLQELRGKLKSIDEKLAERKEACFKQIDFCLVKIKEATKTNEALSQSVRRIKRQLSIRNDKNVNI